MKIGLLGESPHDTKSVSNLLSRMYPEFEFVNLIEDIHGSQLDQLQPTKRLLRLEYQEHKPDVVVFIRDLDALVTDKSQVRKRLEYFREFKTVVDRKAVYLLNIWEIEALILFDLDTFMAHYSCNCSYTGDPHDQEKPKEHLKVLHHKYNEVHNSELFAKIDHRLLMDNSIYFKRFIGDFNKFIQ
jgi:hypothetical protein